MHGPLDMEGAVGRAVTQRHVAALQRYQRTRRIVTSEDLATCGHRAHPRHRGQRLLLSN